MNRERYTVMTYVGRKFGGWLRSIEDHATPEDAKAFADRIGDAERLGKFTQFRRMVLPVSALS